ncbi:hypothetical protein OAC63_06290 [Amylibacter sp.]|nr:hypothetical protein [Amylibacter sp.]
MNVQTNDWIRWIAVFLLISFGFSLLFGLGDASRDGEPIGYFFGFWLSCIAFILLPGAIIGGVFALATKKSKLGIWTMIVINGAMTAVIF